MLVLYEKIKSYFNIVNRMNVRSYPKEIEEYDIAVLLVLNGNFDIFKTNFGKHGRSSISCLQLNKLNSVMITYLVLREQKQLIQLVRTLRSY